MSLVIFWHIARGNMHWGHVSSKYMSCVHLETSYYLLYCDKHLKSLNRWVGWWIFLCAMSAIHVLFIDLPQTSWKRIKLSLSHLETPMKLQWNSCLWLSPLRCQRPLSGLHLQCIDQSHPHRAVDLWCKRTLIFTGVLSALDPWIHAMC